MSRYPILCLFVCIVLPARAQVFTYDALTLFDAGFVASADDVRTRFETAAFLSWDAFDENARPVGLKSGLFSRELQVHYFYRIFASTRFRLIAAAQLGVWWTPQFIGLNYGAPWFWLNYRPIQGFPISLRAGAQWGELGLESRFADNELDFCLQASDTQKELDWRLSVSRRFRLNPALPHSSSTGPYERAGNAWHFMAGIGTGIIKNFRAELFLLGYASDEKVWQGRQRPGSQSEKLAFGIRLRRDNRQPGWSSMRLLLDVAGRDENRGFALMATFIP